MQRPTAGCSCLPKCFKALDNRANLYKTALLHQWQRLYCPNHYGLWMHLCKLNLGPSPKQTCIIISPTAGELGWFWHEAIKRLHAITDSNLAEKWQFAVWLKGKPLIKGAASCEHLPEARMFSTVIREQGSARRWYLELGYHHYSSPLSTGLCDSK